jgi:outer membrane biosynthesis protein TonB
MAKNQATTKSGDELKEGAGTATPAPAPEGNGPAMPEPAPPADSPAADLINNMSPPNAEAIAATRAAEVTDTPEVVTNTAPPAKRGRGRPKGSTTTSRVSNLRPGETKDNVAKAQQAEKELAAQESAQKVEASIQMTATAATQMTILTAVILGGEDFAPEKNELAGGMRDDIFLQQSYAAYLRTKNIIDVPPGVALAFALITYVAPRINKPKVQTRVGFVLMKVKNFFGGIFKRKNRDAAQSHFGNDGERQIDVRQAA